MGTLRWVKVILALLVALYVGHALTAGTQHITHPVPSYSTSLLDSNDCWTGDAPDGVEPGHAVIETDRRGPRLVPAAAGYAIWLEGHDGTLYGFCR